MPLSQSGSAAYAIKIITPDGWTPPSFSRSEWPVTVSVAGGADAGGGHAVTDREVEIATPDGEVDAFVAYPSGAGTWPAVIVWTDIFGLRPVFRDMARALAAQGYLVVVPNPFYRVLKGPVGGGKALNFANDEDRAYLMGLGGALTPQTVETDAGALVDWLDAQPQVDKGRSVGVQGYCLGAMLAIRTAAARPDRVAAAAGFHGTRLGGEDPNAPHRALSRTKAEHLQIIAGNDDQTDPQMKDDLRKSLAEAGLPGRIEVYDDAQHGWCVPGAHVYHEARAKQAWGELLALYRRRLG